MGKNTGNGAKIFVISWLPDRGYFGVKSLHSAVGALLCAWAAGWITLGALPLKPRQEPEVPAPPGINTKPCGCASSSALCADIARFFLCGHGPRGGDYVRGSAPKTPAGT